MMLIDAFKEECVLMNEIHRPDGEGGMFTEWQESDVVFEAAIVNDSSTLAMIAEKQGVTSTYTITTDASMVLRFPNVIKRLHDGAIFRITSNGDDAKAPSVSTIQISQVKAERWELTE